MGGTAGSAESLLELKGPPGPALISRPHVWHVSWPALPLQDVAIALEVPDATTVPAAVAKLLRVVASLPRLEAFVGQVCEVRQHMGVPTGGLGSAGRRLHACSGCTRVGALKWDLAARQCPAWGANLECC